MKVTIIPILIGVFGMVTKGLLKRLDDFEAGGWLETIQTTAFLRTVRILKRVLETCCHSNSSERPSAKTDVKNSNERENNKRVPQMNEKTLKPNTAAEIVSKE